MRVVTLDEYALDRHAARLAALVSESSPDGFDAIVGVRRGGSFVCDALCRHLQSGFCRQRHDITLQRPSTARKGSRTRSMLRRLPTPLLDLMRMAESLLLSWHGGKTDSAATPRVVVPDGLDVILRTVTSPKILIVDDAIDSGATLHAITVALKDLNPEARISIAVITVTTAMPVVRADYALYRNRTLIRFPWSSDYKKHREGRHS